MWTRRQVKEKGKYCFKANYWKTVLISLLVLVLFSGSEFSGVSSAAKSAVGTDDIEDSASWDETDSEWYSEDSVDTEFDPDNAVIEGEGMSDSELAEMESVLQGELSYDADDYAAVGIGAIVAVVILALIFVLAIIAIIILIGTVILNPLQVGINRFFLVNLREQAQVKEVGFGFDHNFKTNAITLLLKEVYTLLWTLLLIVPGIVKSYEYSMIPYLLADHPEISRKEAFALSRRLTRGNKWKMFVLDLSFIGWRLLGVITLGLVNIFYVNPYYNMTKAALYEALSKEQEEANVPAAL